MNEQGVGVICDQQANFIRLKINTHDVTIDSNQRQLLNPSTEKWASHVTLTPDGKYILFLAGDRLLCMRRYSDNKLLAQYTVYDPVCSLAVSTNSRYVIVGTKDKRLLTLVIADPDEREHDERIAYVRAMNPGLSMEQAMALMGEANSFDGDSSDDSCDSSDDEAMMRAAEKRMDKRRTDHRDVIFCLQSDDESSSSDDDDKVVQNGRLTRGNTTIQVFDKGLKPTAHDGQIFASSTTCSLQ